MGWHDIIHPSPTEITASSWVPRAPPVLDGITEIELDCETNGLKWWDGDRPVGIGIAYGDRTQYLPWGHKGGGNLAEETVKRWARTELRGKRITNLNTRFDIHMLREWGVDLEEQGNEVSDVGHYAALLDDARFRFSLESIVNDYLDDEQKVKSVGSVILDPKRMADYHAGVVAVRAEADVRQVRKLREVMWPKLDEEGLQRVRQLEDELIYVVCEMEKNGAKIDVDLLDQWTKEVKEQLKQVHVEIARAVGRRFQSTLFEGGKGETGFINLNSPGDMEKLFRHLNLPIARTGTGRPSFTGSILKGIDHPVIKLVLRGSKLEDLLIKYLVPYSETVDRSTGILRYALHQLRAQKDPWSDSRSAGTVSGRFSSTKIHENPDVGLNIQQIMKPEKQESTYGEGWIIRQLHIPGDGDFLSADAMQIEYRMFAARTKSPRLIDAYKTDPLLSFHKLMHATLQKWKPTLTYRRTKDLNFAKIYGAGLRKMALMMDYITQEEYLDLLHKKEWRKEPKLKEVMEINAIYEKEIPEAKKLLDRARKLAKERGYVRTLLGRRSRFPDGKRSHKALNAVIQGSAADVMKRKLVELHRVRKETGFLLRYTVHDEVDGDAVGGKETARKVADVLNYQSYNVEVPILWEVNLGPNWKNIVEYSSWQ